MRQKVMNTQLLKLVYHRPKTFCITDMKLAMN